MQHRPYEPDRDLAAVLRIWREAGWIEADNSTQNQATAQFATVGEALVADLDGSAECFVSTAPGEMRYLDTDLPMSAVTAVITSHVARRRRGAGRLTARALADAAAAGAAVAALGMFDQGYYDRLGFATGTPVRWRGFDPADLVVPVPPRTPLRLTLDDWEAMHASRLSGMRLHGAMTITPAGFTRAEMGIEGGFGFGFRDETGTLTHHMWCSAKEMEHGPLTVHWAYYRTYRELLDLLAVLQGLGDQYHLVRMREVPGISLQDLLRRPFRSIAISKASKFETGTEAHPYWQARILDLGRCLAAVEIAGEPIELNLIVDDPVTEHLPEEAPWGGVGGEYMATLGAGGILTEGRDPALPTLEVSVGALTRMWLGVLPASGLAATDRLSAPPELLDLLDRGFRLPQPDPVWDF